MHSGRAVVRSRKIGRHRAAEERKKAGAGKRGTEERAYLGARARGLSAIGKRNGRLNSLDHESNEPVYEAELAIKDCASWSYSFAGLLAARLRRILRTSSPPALSLYPRISLSHLFSAAENRPREDPRSTGTWLAALWAVLCSKHLSS